MKPPHTTPVQLSGLTPIPAGTIAPRDRYEGVDVTGTLPADPDWRGTDLLECAFTDLQGGELNLRAAQVVETTWSGIQLAGLLAQDMSLRHVEITACRIGAVVAFSSVIENVTITHCKLDFVNLRGAKLRNVRFIDTVIGDLDLDEAELDRVAFEDCRIAALATHSAQLRDVDLRGAELARVDAAWLKGATISAHQAVELAALLAEAVGLAVED